MIESLVFLVILFAESKHWFVITCFFFAVYAVCDFIFFTLQSFPSGNVFVYTYNVGNNKKGKNNGFAEIGFKIYLFLTFLNKLRI